jgi:hypothetical protein
MSKINLDTNSGIRPVLLTTRKSGPIGNVAYCNLCDWSTRICAGLNDDGWQRASTYLADHRKSQEHREALARTNRT